MGLPNFIVIGPGKTGTTWLYQCLLAHPQIALARGTKETVFFNENYHRGMPWYEKFFERTDGKLAVGEVSNNYFYSAEAAERIAKHLPEVKLICMLRNPLDRMISQFHWRRRNRVGAASTADAALVKFPEIIARNFYDDYLDIWFKLFQRKQILFIFHDDIKDRPQDLLREIYTFVGVDPAFVPAQAEKRVLGASQARLGGNLSGLKRIGVWLRARGYHRLLTTIKFNPIVLKVLTKPIKNEERESFSPETRQRLLATLAPHIERLEQMIGRDLSAWKL